MNTDKLVTSMPTTRFATLKDVPQLVDLLQDLFRVEADFVPEPEKQRAGLEMLLQEPTRAKVWVVEQEFRIVAMCTLQLVISTAEGNRAGLIEDVVVAPDMRRRGIGSKLLATVQDWARRNNVSRLQLLCDAENATAKHFYWSNQWQPTQLACWRQLIK